MCSLNFYNCLDYRNQFNVVIVHRWIEICLTWNFLGVPIDLVQHCFLNKQKIVGPIADIQNSCHVLFCFWSLTWIFVANFYFSLRPVGRGFQNLFPFERHRILGPEILNSFFLLYKSTLLKQLVCEYLLAIDYLCKVPQFTFECSDQS